MNYNLENISKIMLGIIFIPMIVFTIVIGYYILLQTMIKDFGLNIVIISLIVLGIVITLYYFGFIKPEMKKDKIEGLK